MSKLKLATAWLDGCSGCHMSFLDMDEAAEVATPDVANRAIEFETGTFAAPAPLADVALTTPAFEIGE